jgi:predicted TIM-barrel fold metal-dependent hydrolase
MAANFYSDASGSHSRILGIDHEAPSFAVPPGTCDSHVHVFGPENRFPYAPERKYTPGDASIDDLLTLHGRLEIQRVVLVQPSPYAADNRCLMDALRIIGSRARGVAEIDSGTEDKELDAMHVAGVRGVRLNLESWGISDPAFARRQLRWMAQRIAGRGWHLQLFTNVSVLASMQDCIEPSDLPPIVIDHFCLARADRGVDQPGFPQLLSLVRQGKVWVKLSSPQRISDEPDGAEVTTMARALIAANPARMLWGTDWPHPGPWPGIPRDSDSVESFHPINDGRALNRLAGWAKTPDVIHRILVDNPFRLYGFPHLER